MAASLADFADIVRGVLQNPDIELSAATQFEEIPGWDSMHLIGVVVETECRLSLLFEPDEIEGLHTVGDLLGVTVRKQALTTA